MAKDGKNIRTFLEHIRKGSEKHKKKQMAKDKKNEI